MPPASLNARARREQIETIKSPPALLRQAVKELAPERFKIPYREGGWSICQIVHHLPESHMNSYIRFKLALTENESTIKPYDETAWVLANG